MTHAPTGAMAEIAAEALQPRRRASPGTLVMVALTTDAGHGFDSGLVHALDEGADWLKDSTATGHLASRSPLMPSDAHQRGLFDSHRS